MLAYIWFRFRSPRSARRRSSRSSTTAWITLGLCSIFGVEISLTVVAAFLTLIGYSVNDTVVVYDRIRENLEKPKKEAARASREPVDQRDALADGHLTAFLTFLDVVALFFFGGEVIRRLLVRPLRRDRSSVTYSTIFIAAPLVVNWETWRAKRAGRGPGSAPPKNGKPAAAKSR